MRKLLSMVSSLTLITLVCGFLLGAINQVTEVRIKQNAQQTQIEAARAIFPDATVAEESRAFGIWLGYELEERDGVPTITQVPRDTTPLVGWRSWITRLRGETLLPGDRLIALGPRRTQGLSLDEALVGLAVERNLTVRPQAGQGEIELTANSAQGWRLLPVTRGSESIGVAFESTADGFGGTIGIMVGFDMTKNTVAGASVTNHKETPGLGARAKTDPSFCAQFKNQPFDTAFQVRQDGGQIDAISGATVTSRAVCKAVSDAVGFVKTHSTAIKQLIASSPSGDVREGGAQ